MVGGDARDDDKYKNSAFWQLLVPPGLRWMGTRLWNVLLHSEGFLSMDTDYFKNVLRHNIGPSTFQEVRYAVCGIHMRYLFFIFFRF